ncbi:MAG: hypothetical protein AVDCRST_MAG56-3050 [uncultured Cytophagales bacterium]|uniref:Tail specific protease domain-containing protein n=1 Tax=uncultured Cytophagales bacterium TaxID=158755 RepID=A0A6J4J4J1_9SPHI|nr:MAG: hypothetical protein AVDCRST_MAG56-3050 [uncultured Cytophagales bacterium]
MSKYCFSLILIVAWGTLPAQPAAEAPFDAGRKFAAAALRQDLTVLRDSLRAVHPALYRYTPKRAWDSLFAAACRQINKPLSGTEFYAIAAPLIGRAGDIHTAVELPDPYHDYLATRSDLLPFDVRITGDSVFIASNNSTDTSIPVGSRLLNINGVPIAAVLAKLKSYFSSDGTNGTLKVRRVEQRFAFQYQFTYGYSKQFAVTYAPPGERPRTKTVAALPFAVIKENRAKNRQAYPKLKPLFPQPPYLALALHPEKQRAVLTIRWFQNDVLESNGQRFKPFVDSALGAIHQAGVRNLVIDVRNNGGGESGNASYLYAYLAGKPFRLVHCIEASPATYRADAAAGVQYAFHPATGTYRTADSTASPRQFFGLATQPSRPNPYAGAVYVLVDGLTTSAAAQFASLVKRNNRGTLIGEEAPGALAGGSGREYARFALPHSGLLTVISRYRSYLTDPNLPGEDGCVAPDHQPAASMNDLFNGVDKDLELALKLMDKSD